MPEYEIRIETPVYIPPKLVAASLKKKLKEILERYGQYTIEARVEIEGQSGQAKEEEEEIAEEA